MGKIKERRFRYHKKLVKASLLNAGKGEKKEDEEVTVEHGDMPLSTESNIFEGTEINLDKILGFVHKDVDNKSVSGVSKQEVKKDEQVLSKKERIKLRREKFLQKLQVIYGEKKTKKKKKKKPAQSFDMEPFLESLPVTTETVENSKAKKKKPNRMSMKAKQRLKENSKDLKHFQRILNDTNFAKNPTLTLIHFLKQKVESSRPDLKLDD